MKHSHSVKENKYHNTGKKETEGIRLLPKKLIEQLCVLDMSVFYWECILFEGLSSQVTFKDEELYKRRYEDFKLYSCNTWIGDWTGRQVAWQKASSSNDIYFYFKLGSSHSHYLNT